MNTYFRRLLLDFIYCVSDFDFNTKRFDKTCRMYTDCLYKRNCLSSKSVLQKKYHGELPTWIKKKLSWTFSKFLWHSCRTSPDPHILCIGMGIWITTTSVSISISIGLGLIRRCAHGLLSVWSNATGCLFKQCKMNIIISRQCGEFLIVGPNEWLSIIMFTACWICKLPLTIVTDWWAELGRGPRAQLREHSLLYLPFIVIPWLPTSWLATNVIIISPVNYIS